MGAQDIEEIQGLLRTANSPFVKTVVICSVFVCSTIIGATAVIQQKFDTLRTVEISNTTLTSKVENDISPRLHIAEGQIKLINFELGIKDN